jgi:hypothetical protein
MDSVTPEMPVDLSRSRKWSSDGLLEFSKKAVPSGCGTVRRPYEKYNAK